MLEHRLTVFAHQDAPDVTPGQAGAPAVNKRNIVAAGRAYSSEATLRCFECHTTINSDRGRLVLDEATMIPNVGCERCHGPGQAHVEAARRGAPDPAFSMAFGAGRSSADDEIRLCGTCHRLPGMGEPGTIGPDNPVMVRFQPIGLIRSACYQKSQGKL
jgi:hypothetical protein